MDQDPWAPVTAAAQQLLDDLPTLVEELGRVVRDRVPGYAAVSGEQLRAASGRNVRDLLQSLHERRPLTATELDHFTATVEERARNGVPVDEYLSAVTAAEGLVWDSLWRRARGVPEATRLEAFALRFTNVNAITRVTVTAHRRIEVAAARADQERRAGALRALLRGGLQPEEADEHLARLGLTPADAWFVVRARPRPPLDADRLAASLRRDLDPSGAVVLLSGEQAVGLLREPPRGVADATLGFAGPVDVAGLSDADDEAGAVLETAWRLGLRGAVDLGAVGLPVAVQAWPRLGARLRARWVDPVLGSGTLGDELLDTVRVHLACGGRRELTAERLHVHKNTVGYRVNRYCELTGADLHDLRTLAELHWVFTDLDLGAPA